MKGSQKRSLKIFPEIALDEKNSNQEFYKKYSREHFDSVFIKHGYKLVNVTQEVEDLAFYCLALLQAEAIFPCKIFHLNTVEKKKSSTVKNISSKVFWLETMIMLTSVTINEAK